METPPADQVLVARVKDGDNGAFGEIVTLYWDRIFARAFQLLKNREDAEEVTQDTFIRAQKGLENFRGDSAFSTWLYQIATNLAHNRYWYWWRRKRSASFSLDQNLTQDSDATLADVLPAEGEDPGEATLTQEFVDRVSSCMQQLNEKHREILVLRNVHNLSYEEIAEELRISVGTVKSRIARARESLREQMGSDFK
ncbi:sigma-70 family RNA polymerase sigma factor [Ruficoccus amylovorans]|uniref:RNA polymerase sigma factor n=1 Tax=Ruficoccus amylovorans TaxID=1804625 RepID=A0A842HCJ5_9BACT|nr:sigma-70 family RNA polymerase sigma factor [Ruficoccus amylovorans]MBC2593264.1 sigma-70 family RNA polymerase sigma factor [Ruficoccus amylovorans]